MLPKSDQEPSAQSNTPLAQLARIALLVLGRLGGGAAAGAGQPLRVAARRG